MMHANVSAKVSAAPALPGVYYFCGKAKSIYNNEDRKINIIQKENTENIQQIISNIDSRSQLDISSNEKMGEDVSAPSQPYEKENIVYVGKAKNLRKRLQSYIRKNLSSKTSALMKSVVDVQTIVTNNETEALLLEQTLIKRYRPRFNILLRDDKSYPFLHLSAHHQYPWLMVRRGNQVKSGKLFGPYINGFALRQTLRLLQQVFRLRHCSDAFFANRSRACMQYQIGRCSAPCVGYITPADYQIDVDMALECIRGNNTHVAQLLQQQMDQASAQLAYEKAAVFRDRLVALRKVQEEQNVTSQDGNLDIVALAQQHGVVCVCHMQVRKGKVVANRTNFPHTPMDETDSEILEQFLSNWYLTGSLHPDIPSEILISHQLEQTKFLVRALYQQQGKKVHIVSNVRAKRSQLLNLAIKNAEQAVFSRLANKRHHHGRLLAFTQELALQALPSRIECFDISHTSGEKIVASCVVFGADGPNKNAYRIYHVQDITPGDDYGAIGQVLTRRFQKMTEEDKPQVLCIDGGKGQTMVALQVLNQVQREMLVIGIAKGPLRKAGLETLYVWRPGMPKEAKALQEIHLRPESPALHFIQHIRDESHRFALRHHRSLRAKSRKTSRLEGIPGIGPAKRRELLRYFGSVDGVATASERDLQRVCGISIALAKTIYGHFHSA